MTKLTPYEVGQMAKRKAEERARQEKALDREFDKHLKVIPEDRVDPDDWQFEHDDLNCPRCEHEGRGEHPLNFYLGTHKGEDGHKYECTNPECDFENIELIKDMKVE